MVMSYRTFVFASDLHGDQQEPRAVEALLRFCDSFKPDIRVFGGDLFDFRPLRMGAGATERNESMMCDVEAGLEFLNKFKPNIFLLGNHDDRIWRVARDTENGILRDTAVLAIKDIKKRCAKLKCRVIDYNSSTGIYRLGNIAMMHGFAAGMYAAKKHAESFSPPGGLAIHGHTHSIQHHSIARLGGGSGMSAGCLAKLDMEYNKHTIGRLMHAHGFVYGYVDKKGWGAWQAKESNGKWILPEKLTEI
jgi:predicted MPP superfamily phosphohydrolase